ncbi:putative sugar-binding domain-containing protein [Ditylenchus destructor]|uniref:Sugar-binding domain-containing protein n=1 Tax=Ditylenchus destructor TaxID=166010 RepID=A0AAD4QSK5_9BILA|nr:putative sugar-binding domain-containing protein [Ditylenchus destructor]
MAKRTETAGRLDDAARAGWLYYVAGRTQDEIASAMGISRQCVSTTDRPVPELGEELRRTFGLVHVDIVPSDPGSTSTTIGIAEAGAAEIERWLKKSEPIVLAVGTGRTLKAAIDQLPTMECPQHRIMSLTGNISPDGSGCVLQRHLFHGRCGQGPALSDAVAGSGVLDGRARPPPQAEPRAIDATARPRGGRRVRRYWRTRGGPPRCASTASSTAGNGAADGGRGRHGEICGWMFDRDGKLLHGSINERVASVPLPPRETTTVIGLAKGKRKHLALLAALRGGMINGIITDETTARYLLSA